MTGGSQQATAQAECPTPEEHTGCPQGYLAWHEWAARMYRQGRRQRKCPGCGRYKIWLPKPSGAVSGD